MAAPETCPGRDAGQTRTPSGARSSPTTATAPPSTPRRTPGSSSRRSVPSPASPASPTSPTSRDATRRAPRRRWRRLARGALRPAAASPAAPRLQGPARRLARRLRLARAAAGGNGAADLAADDRGVAAGRGVPRRLRLPGRPDAARPEGPLRRRRAVLPRHAVLRQLAHQRRLHVALAGPDDGPASTPCPTSGRQPARAHSTPAPLLGAPRHCAAREPTMRRRDVAGTAGHPGRGAPRSLPCTGLPDAAASRSALE